MYRDRTRNWDHDPTSRNPASGSLAADHTIARATGKKTRADRLLHGRCNDERQDGTRDHLRPALTGATPTPTPAGRHPHHAMPWPTPPKPPTRHPPTQP